MLKNCDYVSPVIKNSAEAFSFSFTVGQPKTVQINLADRFEIDPDCSISQFKISKVLKASSGV